MSKAIQIFGYSALERIAEAPKFNKWMYDTIRPFLSGDILEVGSGIGNISSYVIQDEKSVTLSDYDPNYIHLLKDKFSQFPSVKDVIELDLAKEAFQEKYAQVEKCFDTVFLLNVLEHIENEIAAIANIRFLLKPGGKVVVLVPSYTFLYAEMDRLLGHYKRYTIQSLKTVIQQNNFVIEKAFYFNALGIAGWLWNKVFKQAEISHQKMNLFNQLVPVARGLDKVLFHKVGLSTILVAQKPDTEE